MVKKNITPISDLNARLESTKIFNKQIVKDNIGQLSQHQYSNSSELAMTTDWNRFVSFCDLKQVQALPTSVTAIRLFLEQEARERKFSSIRRYSITIGSIHHLHGYPDPTAHRQVRFTLAQLKHLKTGDARQANALTQKHLTQLQDILARDKSSRSMRDNAIYHLMFECALKRSDLKTIQIDNLESDQNLLVLNINDHRYRLSHSATLTVKKWLHILAKESGGYLFRRIDKHGNIGTHQLDDSSIYRILRRASDLLGLAKEHRFTGQSARVGAAKELEKQGYQLKEIQDFGRWLSPAMPAQYLEQTHLAEGEMAKFRVIKPWD